MIRFYPEISSKIPWDRLRKPRNPEFWLLVILVLGLGIRLWYLTKPFDWFVSFFPADDCFYYLNTVLNIVHGHGASFDGGITTHNGFHPLFLIMLLIPAAAGAGKVGLVYWAMGILTASCLFAAVMAYRLGALWGDRYLALCVPASLALNIFFIKISFSGFETALALALVLTLFDAVARGRTGWILGLLLGLCGLARIELLILALPVALHLLQTRKWRDLMSTAVVSLVMVLPWFIWSYTNFHSLLPISGVAKISPFQLDRLWPGLESISMYIPYTLGGYGLRDWLPHQVAFAIGIIFLFLAARSWRRAEWPLLGIILLILIYNGFTNPLYVSQLIRYCVPCLVLVGILAYAHSFKPTVLVPVVVTFVIIYWSFGFFSWSARTGTLPTFVGLGESCVPDILDQIAGPDDVVGCFDSGSIGYFSRRPVVNLDGLVNSDIGQMLRSPEGGTWTDRYLKYFSQKGITILVGGTAFSWSKIFPDLDRWKVLHAPLTSADGGQIVFLRVPATGHD